MSFPEVDMKPLAFLPLVTFVLVACQDLPTKTEPSAEPPVLEIVDAAHNAVTVARRRGAEFGLTDRDVVVALLRPVFTKTRGCDCPTCKTRREKSREQKDVVDIDHATHPKVTGQPR